MEHFTWFNNDCNSIQPRNNTLKSKIDNRQKDDWLHFIFIKIFHMCVCYFLSSSPLRILIGLSVERKMNVSTTWRILIIYCDKKFLLKRGANSANVFRFCRPTKLNSCTIQRHPVKCRLYSRTLTIPHREIDFFFFSLTLLIESHMVLSAIFLTFAILCISAICYCSRDFDPTEI